MLGASAVLDQDVCQLSDEPVPCESPYERDTGKPPHEAHFYAITTCDVTAICHDRAALARKQRGWTCVPGCGGFHSINEIRFVPIS